MLVRYLLQFGAEFLYEEERDGQRVAITVGEYIIRELAEDELLLLNPRLREIQQEYRQHCGTPGFLPARYFTGHADPEISAVVADVLSEPYELSKLWDHADGAANREENKLSIRLSLGRSIPAILAISFAPPNSLSPVSAYAWGSRRSPSGGPCGE